MRTIILYGELAKRFGKHHRYAVKTTNEALRALKANFKDFESYFCSAHTEGYGFKIIVGDRGLRDYSEAALPTGSNEVIRIVPAIIGSKSGWVKILIGAVLVYAGYALASLSETSPAFGAAGSALMGIGISMIIGGAAQLLTNPPDVPGNSAGDRRESYIFSGPENTSAQGKPVPVGYGRMIVGSAVISAGIEAFDDA